MKIYYLFLLSTFLFHFLNSNAQPADKFLQTEKLNDKVKSILETTYSFSEKFGQIEKDGLINKSISRYDIWQNPILYKQIEKADMVNNSILELQILQNPILTKSFYNQYGGINDNDKVTLLEYDKNGIITGINTYFILDYTSHLSLENISKIKERSETNLVFNEFKPTGELNSTVVYRLNSNGLVLERKILYSGGRIEILANKYDSFNRLIEFSCYSNQYSENIIIKYSGFDMNDNPTNVKMYDKKGIILNEYSYEYAYDSLDNWSKRTVYTKGKPLFVAERSITYFGSKNKRKTDWEQNGFNGKVKLSIESVYQGDYRFGKIEKGQRSESIFFFFDEEGELIQLNKEDLTTINKYDINGNIIESFVVGNKDVNGYKYFYKYDSIGNLIEQRKLPSYGDEEKISFIYNNSNLLIEKRFYLEKFASGNDKELFAYDGNGFLIARRGFRGNIIRSLSEYLNDDKGNIVRVIRTYFNDDGTLNGKSKDTSEYEYDSFGNWIRKIEVRSRVGHIKEREIIYYPEKEKSEVRNLLQPSKELNCNPCDSNRFLGTWLSDIPNYVPDILNDYTLEINEHESDWYLRINQLYMGFSNKYLKDTLFLYFKDIERGRGFSSFKGTVPKKGSLFAKCLINSNNQLSIFYLNYSFIKSIKACINFTTKEQEMTLFPQLMISKDDIDKNSLLRGLVAYYPFSGNTKDESGNNNHGVANGGTLTTDRNGTINNAYSFDGSNYIKVPNSTSLSSAENTLTISAWVYNLDRLVSVVCKSAYRGPSLQFRIFTDKEFFFANNGKSADFTTALNPLNTWKHIVITSDGRIANFYLNGVLKSSVPTTFAENANDHTTEMYIGADTHGIPEYYRGKLDEIRIYNRELSPKEIKQLYDF